MGKKLIIITSLSTLIRLFLSFLMFWASFSKLLFTSEQIARIMVSIRGYKIVPEIFVKPFAIFLPSIEILIAIMLLCGLGTRFFAIALCVLLIIFIIGIIQAGIRGLQIDCGCFSPGGELLPGQKTQYTLEVLRDFGCILLCAFLAIFPRTFFSLDNVFGNK